MVCTPNDLHETHAAMGLRLGADAILEKPPALSSRGMDSLAAMEARTGHQVHPVLQMRYHDGLQRFRDMMARRDPKQPHVVTLRYVTRRGPWFGASWKGDPRRSGSILFNIGIHMFDALTWALGPATGIVRASARHGGKRRRGHHPVRRGHVRLDAVRARR